MPRSIAKRVHWTVFSITIVSLVIAFGLVYLGYEDMEQTMLALEIQAEREFLLDDAAGNAPSSWNTAEIRAYFQPNAQVDQQSLPGLFHGLPFPFSGEIETEGETYLVTTSKAGGGRLYVAKNISSFERREFLFTTLLAITCLVVITLSYVLARVSSQRLARPLQQLAGRIGDTLPGRRMPRLPPNFVDVELAAIAARFNNFLDELEAYMKREQSLLGLASHELRTPIAVIGGALDVIEQRDQLHVDDRRTLARARRANQEMSANVDMILKLARRKQPVEQAVECALPDIARELLDELDPALDSSSRVTLETANAAPVVSDPVLVKMLLRNLIHNALQHTSDRVTVRFEPGLVEIADRGGGLPEAYRRLLMEREIPSADIAALSGLGLFIVSLICERLGWRIEIPQCTAQGTTLRLVVGSQR